MGCHTGQVTVSLPQISQISPPTFIEEYEVVGAVTPHVNADLDHVASRQVDVSFSATVSSTTHLDALPLRHSVRQHSVADPTRLSGCVTDAWTLRTSRHHLPSRRRR